MKKKQVRWLRLFLLGLATAVGVVLTLYFFPIGLSLFASSLIVLTSGILSPFAKKQTTSKNLIVQSLTLKESIKQPSSENVTNDSESPRTEIEVFYPFGLPVSGSTEGAKMKKSIVSLSLKTFDPNNCLSIGKGAFAQVFMLEVRETESKIYFFAVKAARRDFFSWLLPTEEEEALKSEADILVSLRHSNILPAYGRFTTKNYDCMVIPLMDTSLSQHVEKQTKAIDDDWIATVTRCILSGLAYLHENGWVHRDIKLENILIRKNNANSELKVCLADFGLAEQENSQTTFAGTLPWVSTELYTHFFDEKKNKLEVNKCGRYLSRSFDNLLPLSSNNSALSRYR